MTSPDDDLHALIDSLEKSLHEMRSAPPPHDIAQMAELEREVDQQWDLLRRREASRHAGNDPLQERVRPQSEVEGYQQ